MTHQQLYVKLRTEFEIQEEKMEQLKHRLAWKVEEPKDSSTTTSFLFEEQEIKHADTINFLYEENKPPSPPSPSDPNRRKLSDYVSV